MLTGPAADSLVASIARVCRSGLDPQALRESVLPRLQSAIPTDALWWALADPTTLLFTQTYREELPASTGAYFVENEFLCEDVNKWTDLAQSSSGVATLMHATDSDPSRSARYRDIFEPMGLHDELRSVMRVRGSSWGLLCLHREKATATFSVAEEQLLRRIAPHLAEGIRMGLLRQARQSPDAATGPGVILLDADGDVVSVSAAAERLLGELGGSMDRSGLPLEIRALATLLSRLDPTQLSLPPVRIRTSSGQWLALHSSRMTPPNDTTIAIIMEEATPADLAPLIMTAYGLTERERTICGLICQGLTTRRISDHLHLTTDTVQDHVKSIYARTGVHSRGELVATILRRDYLPYAAGA